MGRGLARKSKMSHKYAPSPRSFSFVKLNILNIYILILIGNYSKTEIFDGITSNHPKVRLLKIGGEFSLPFSTGGTELDDTNVWFVKSPDHVALFGNLICLIIPSLSCSGCL